MNFSRELAALVSMPLVGFSFSWSGAQEISGESNEVVVVTATRVESDLQRTPLSVQSLDADSLDRVGIDTGRNLGIVVPNLVIASGGGTERQTAMTIRGLPGVTVYVDGIWQGNLGLQQRSFVELDRIEILRGPQGTLFGRNTNGGAVQLVTRPPGDEFEARISWQVGEFGHRKVSAAIDWPIADRLKTKWTMAGERSDGFLENPATGSFFGQQDDTLFRGDLLWEPTDDLSLRFNVNTEQRRSSDARSLRISNTQNPSYIAYNVLAGNPDFLDQARAIDPNFPDPPMSLPGVAFTRETHEPGYPEGRLGPWQTRTDGIAPTTIIDGDYLTLRVAWKVTDRWTLESLSFAGEGPGRQTSDYDASEFTIGHQILRDRLHRGESQELHLIGKHFDGRLRTLLGLYHLKTDIDIRTYSWWFWEFAVPNVGPNPGRPGPPGAGGRPVLNVFAVDYVQSWGAVVGNPVLAAYSPPTFLTTDQLVSISDIDRAFFSQIGVDLTEKIELSLGYRLTRDDGGLEVHEPNDAFRGVVPGVVPSGNPFASAGLIAARDKPDLGTISTPRVSISYSPDANLYMYASYAEGFTAGAIASSPVVADPIELDPEVVKTKEFGLRSDWLDRRLILNATMFRTRWDGLRVNKLIDDPANPGQVLPQPVPTSDGNARASGLEIDIVYRVTERWSTNFALGLLDTEYLDIGVPQVNGTGLQPGIPFAYAPEKSFSLGTEFRFPFERGGEIRFAGSYGWMDEYERASAAQFQTVNADGSRRPEPAYGLLNGRIAYAPAGKNWSISAYATNLTNERYVSGGFDTGQSWGFDIVTLGRPRELGIGMSIELN